MAGRASAAGEAVRLLLQSTPDAPASEHALRGVGGPELAAALTGHRVSCTLHPVIARLTDVPIEVTEVVRNRRRSMALSLLAMQADLAWIQPILQGIGAPWVVVKGPAVATTLYADLLQREWSDLDIVVDRSAFPDVLRALEGAGARLVDQQWALIRERRQGQLSLALPHGTPLDLHWHFINGRQKRQAFAVDMDEVLAYRRQVDISGLSLPVLSATDQLMHLCLHACLSGGHRLQWLKDVQLAASGVRSWDEVTARAQRFAVGLPMSIVLERTANYLGARVPWRTLSELGGRSVWRMAARAASRLAPPADSHLKGRSGKIVFVSTRRNDPRSLAAFAGRLRERGHVAAPEAAVGTDNNPLHRPGGSERDRAEYLCAVASR